jgi:hypothetical protein
LVSVFLVVVCVPVVAVVPVVPVDIEPVAVVSVDIEPVPVVPVVDDIDVSVDIAPVPVVPVMAVSVELIVPVVPVAAVSVVIVELDDVMPVSVAAVSVLTFSSFLQPTAKMAIANRATIVVTRDFFICAFSLLMFQTFRSDLFFGE